jgi:hypothetical protein
MKALRKILLAQTAVAAVSIVYPTSVHAVPTTYQYKGNPFTTVSGPYTTSDFVTAMVTLAGPLGANMPLTQVTPTAFTLSDGVQTLSNLDNGVVATFLFGTDASGAIVEWAVAVGVIDGTTLRNITTNESPPGGHFDEGTFFTPHQGRELGFNSLSPGVWSATSAVPDAESTLSLMALTLVALGLVTRQFQRVAGYPRQCWQKSPLGVPPLGPLPGSKNAVKCFSRAVFAQPLRDQTHCELVYRPLQFHERS